MLQNKENHHTELLNKFCIVKVFILIWKILYEVIKNYRFIISRRNSNINYCIINTKFTTHRCLPHNHTYLNGGASWPKPRKTRDFHGAILIRKLTKFLASFFSQSARILHISDKFDFDDLVFFIYFFNYNNKIQ